VDQAGSTRARGRLRPIRAVHLTLWQWTITQIGRLGVSVGVPSRSEWAMSGHSPLREAANREFTLNAECQWQPPQHVTIFLRFDQCHPTESRFEADRDQTHCWACLNGQDQLRQHSSCRSPLVSGSRRESSGANAARTNLDYESPGLAIERCLSPPAE
jgi:hypothetical protein